VIAQQSSRSAVFTNSSPCRYWRYGLVGVIGLVALVSARWRYRRRR